MNTKLAALIICFFSIFIIIRAIQIFRRGRIASRIFLLWVLIWASIGFFALFPSLLDNIMKFVNMGNRLFFLTTIAIIILFMVLFYVTSVLSRLTRRVSKSIQEIALLNYKLEKIEGEERKMNKIMGISQ